MIHFPADPSETLNRQSCFSFECGRCSQCCIDKRIQINPYEIARLAANLGISTTDFIASFTSRGVYLAANDDGSCVFIRSDGCAVHADRPLACRLYPLGRHISRDGIESFIFSHLHPDCRAGWEKERTVEDYLREQDVHAFFNASECYRSLLKKLAEALGEEKGFRLPEWISVFPGSDLQVSFPNLLDPDWVIHHHTDRKHPTALDPWEKMKLHVKTVEGWLNNNKH